MCSLWCRNGGPRATQCLELLQTVVDTSQRRHDVQTVHNSRCPLRAPLAHHTVAGVRLPCNFNGERTRCDGLATRRVAGQSPCRCVAPPRRLPLNFGMSMDGQCQAAPVALNSNGARRERVSTLPRKACRARPMWACDDGVATSEGRPTPGPATIICLSRTSQVGQKLSGTPIAFGQASQSIAGWPAAHHDGEGCGRMQPRGCRNGSAFCW